ncbi:MAG: chromosomal replication initiator protein DnaA [Bifidobacteriaceae bacterium]|nr:chromosomal replication initiator protein DnaA [Bifidobacteriaceae bacterium]
MAQTADASTIWEHARTLLLANKSLSERYKGCITDITPMACLDDIIVLNVPNEMTRLTIENRVDSEMKDALRIASGRNMTYVIKITGGAEKPTPESPDIEDSNDALTIAVQATENTRMNAGMAHPNTPQPTPVRPDRQQEPNAMSQGFDAQNGAPNVGFGRGSAAPGPSAMPSNPPMTQGTQQSAAYGDSFATAPLARQPVTPPSAQRPLQSDPAYTNQPQQAYMPETQTSYAPQQGAAPTYHNVAPSTPKPMNPAEFAANYANSQALASNTMTSGSAARQPVRQNPDYPAQAQPAFAQQNQPSYAAGPRAAQTQHGVQQVNRDEQTHLNTLATFDTFVAGDSNNFADAIAMAVAEAPGKSFNPLCIYGGPGLGKTHLLNAIGNEALRENPNLKVRYANSEEFTNDFIEAVRNSSNDPTMVANFNKRYREVDILLIDDIQFMRGEETMRQFFHTFNTLYQANKQIVIASDVPPKDLKGFEQRLISRFDSGISVDVQPPDLETRIAILRMKAQANGMSVPSDVLNLIAEQITDNVRELEGALTRVHAMASLSKQPLTRSLAEQTLQDFFTNKVEITPTEIITTTANYFQLTFDDLVGTSRTKNIATARQIAMYLTREMTNLSLVDIGDIFGGRDHSTVMHAYRKISSEMSEKREVYNYVTELTVVIKRKGGTAKH